MYGTRAPGRETLTSLFLCYCQTKLKHGEGFKRVTALPRSYLIEAPGVSAGHTGAIFFFFFVSMCL